MMNLVAKMAKTLHGDYFEYIYRGNFTPQITQNIINLTEKKFYVDDQTKTIRKRISFIMIECLQNITRHQDKPDDFEMANSDLFILQKFSNAIFVSAGNIVKNEHISSLKHKLDSVIGLTADELKKHYKDVLESGEISDKGGAGLGILSMARRTEGNIVYKFRKINDEYSYYYIQNRIFLENEPPTEDFSDLFSLDRISKFHLLLNRENILLNFNGEFAFDNLESILPILETQAIGQKKTKRIAFELTVKLLKNIIFFGDNDNHYDESNPNSDNTRGVFLLCKQNNHLYLTTSNLIQNSKVLLLKNKIDLINSLEKESLPKIKIYLEEFFETSESNKPDLSLIDMRQKSNNEIYYSIKKINDKVSFFIIQVII